MRNAFADEITKVAAEDPRVCLLSGDIGNRLFNTFKEKFPDRFFNCGVAEADMMGVAAGLALSGMRPVVYTITPFTTFRCFEQIKIDVCYHEAPVVIVGVGSGLGYASLGPTHHSLEDVGALRLFPGLTILCPGDPLEVRAAVRALLRHNGPAFLRLGKKGEPAVHSAVPDVRIGRALVMKKGSDVGILSTGAILPNAMEAGAALEKAGVSAEVVSFLTVKPLDEQYLADAFARFRLVVTLEEHSLLGGLGGSVAEWLADYGPQKAGLLRFGTRDEFLHESGGVKFARKFFGLDAPSVTNRILEKLKTR